MNALEGLRGLDQTQVMAGPFSTMLLADMGAEVIKIEPPGGETTRQMTLQVAPGVAAAFVAVNRNKRGLVLDLKQPDGVAILKQLAATADVLVENYRPGVARRLGVDYDTLSKLNPRLIYRSVSGFGQTGPYADQGGYDLIAQGMSGIMSVTGTEGGAPVKVGVPVADLGAGLFAAFGILCAVRARRVTGRGHFTVGASNEKLWPLFAGVLGLDHLVTDPRFATVKARVENRAALQELLEQVTRKEPRQHWLALCEAAGIPAGPIYNVPEALADPHAQARGMVQELDHPVAGRVKGLGNPVTLSASPATMRKAAPVLGEDTEALLAELGYGAAETTRLREKGVLGP